MKRRLTTVVTGLATVVTAGGFLFASGGVASAATPTYEPDPYSVGTLTFYDAGGHVITHGALPANPNTTQAFAAYVVGSTNVNGNDTKATLYYATPNPGTPNTWGTQPVNGSNSFPVAGAPAPVSGTTKPVWKGSASDDTLTDYSTSVPNAETGTNANVYEIRMYTNNPSAATTSYDSADVLYDPTGHTWTQVYPTSTATATTVTAAPAAQTAPASAVTLSATVTPNNVPGTVTFFHGTTQVGTPVATNNGAATANATYTPSGVGSEQISARFDPTPGYSSGSASAGTLNEYTDSTGTATYTVSAPADTTSTAVGTTHGASVTDAFSATATVTDTTTPATAVNSGTVQFTYQVSTDGGATYGAASNLGSPVTVTSSGSATYSNANGLPYPSGAGPFTYKIAANYSGVASTFSPSTGSASPFTLTAPTTSPVCATETTAPNCTDAQNITGTVPTGSLTITTPYGPSNPLNVNLALLPDGSELSGSASFGTAAVGSTPASDIRITDTRSGQPLAWTANALASALTSTSNSANKISAENVGLTNLASVASGGFDNSAANFSTSDNPAAQPAVQPGDTGSLGLGGSTPHAFAHATKGLGTVDLTGKLTIQAPTNTQAGVYGGTITFTVG